MKETRFEVELQELTKDEIIALVGTGALKRVETVTEVREQVVEVKPEQKPEQHKRRKYGMTEATEKKMHKVRMQLAREPKTYTVNEMADKTGLKNREITYLVRNYLQSSKWCKVEKGDKKYFMSPTEITATGDYDVNQRTGLDEWHDYQRKRMKELTGSGMTGGEMVKQIAEEWNRIKNGEKIKKEGSPSLPDLQTVSKKNQHLAKALIVGLFKNKHPITYASAQYFLEFEEQDDFSQFVTEIFQKRNAIKHRLGIDDLKLRFNGNKNRLVAV